MLAGMTNSHFTRTARSRQSGTMITVVHGEDEGLDTETEGPWYAICEAHGFISSHRTLSEARSWSASPFDWCQDCQDAAGKAVR